MSNSSHFIQSLLVERASRYAVRDASSGQESSHSLQLLLCAVGDQRFALELERVESVTLMEGWVRVPHTYPALLGVLHTQNQLFSLFDTAQLLQIREAPLPPYSHAVILSSKTQRVALACTALHDLIALPRTELMEHDTFTYQNNLVSIYRPEELLLQLDQAI